MVDPNLDFDEGVSWKQKVFIGPDEEYKCTRYFARALLFIYPIYE